MKFTGLVFSCSKLLTISSLSIALISCGGIDQDTGEPSEVLQKYSGIVMDGYLARATVFIDTNNNGTRDAWEPWAFTDNDGYYSYNPKTDVDYCSATATAQQQQYCLISNVSYSNAVVRIDGGYDVVTGEPFLGQLSKRVDASSDAAITDSLISPITTLFTSVETEQDSEALLASLGLTNDSLEVDYLNEGGTGAVDPMLLNTALKIHKVTSILSDRLTDTYTEIGDNFGTPNDAFSSVYPSLAQQIIESNSTLDQALSSETLLLQTLDNAETLLQDVYQKNELTLPPDMGSVSNPGEFTRVVQVSSKINSVVNQLIDVGDTDFNIDDALGASRALESVVIKVVEEPKDTNDNTIDNAIEFFENEANSDLVNALIESLAEDTADINALADNDFEGDDFDSEEEIAEASSYDESIQPFSQVGSRQLKISDLNLGFGPNNLDDSELEFYFSGDESALEGSFKVCLKYINDAHEDGTLEAGSTRGELLDGFWSKLSANSESGDSYSLLITLTFLGTTYQAIIKPYGMETVTDIEYKVIRFDFDGELKDFHSVLGLTQLGEVPSSNSECEEKLPSRIGI
jgi:hypothetical protein